MILEMLSLALAAPLTAPLDQLEKAGAEINDYEDGTWSMGSNPENLKVGARLEKKGLTWEYLGLNSLPREVSLFDSLITSRPGSLENNLIGTMRLDSNGGLWELIDADPEILDVANETAKAHALEGEGFETWMPTTFTTATCGTQDIAIDGYDSRTATPNYTHDLHKGVILVKNLFGGQCTGVKVGPRAVLTAAHCVTTASSSPNIIPVAGLCSRGNDNSQFADCSNSNGGGLFNYEVTVNANWLAGSQARIHDFALVEWGTMNLNAGPTNNIWENFDRQSLTGTVSGGLPFSQAGQGSIEQNSVGHYGYSPFKLNNSGFCTSQTVASKDAFVNMSGHKLFRQWSSSHVVNGGLLETNFDISSGQSGAPIFNCTGNCTTGAGIVALMVGFRNTPPGSPFAPNTGGPRATVIEPFVNALL